MHYQLYKATTKDGMEARLIEFGSGIFGDSLIYDENYDLRTVMDIKPMSIQKMQLGKISRKLTSKILKDSHRIKRVVEGEDFTKDFLIVEDK